MNRDRLRRAFEGGFGGQGAYGGGRVTNIYRGYQLEMPFTWVFPEMTPAAHGYSSRQRFSMGLQFQRPSRVTRVVMTLLISAKDGMLLATGWPPKDGANR